MRKFRRSFRNTGGEDLFLPRSRIGHTLRPIFMLCLVKMWQVTSCGKFMQHLKSCLLWQLKLTEFLSFSTGCTKMKYSCYNSRLQSRKSDLGWHCFRFSPRLKSLKQYCHLRQDNTWCYHWVNTILACRTFEQSTGIKVVCMDFSDPQGDKGVVDRLAATCKNHIWTYINAGNNVTTTAEMKEALLSYGGVEGVWVAILLSIEETVELQKISGISKINNFLFTEDSLQAWRTYAIGPGKTIASEKVPGRCHYWEVNNKKGECL